MRICSLAACVALVLGACASDRRSAPAAEAAPGYAGALRITPDPARFDEVRPGCTETITVQLEHAGEGGPLTVARIASSNASLRPSVSVPLTLRPGERRPMDVHFAPTSPGDWSGALAFSTDEEGAEPYRLSLSAVAVARPSAPAGPGVREPLDLVFVVDVSTTMDDLPVLRPAIEGLYDFVEGNALDVRIGLVTFVNDVVVHGGGAYLDRAAFLAELDAQLLPGTWVPDPDRPRQVMNLDLAENGLDALQRAATRFAGRPGARRALFLVTDGAFAEGPTVLSDGSSVTATHADVAAVLVENHVRLFALHASAQGRGISSRMGDRPSLVSASGGAWFELSDAVSGALDLRALLVDLVADHVCE